MIKDIDQSNSMPINTSGWGLELYFGDEKPQQPVQTQEQKQGLSTNTLILLVGGGILAYMLLKK